MCIDNFANRAHKIRYNILSFSSLETLQVNVGNQCNQECLHCHQIAGPQGNKIMSYEVIQKILEFLKKFPHLNFDITGGTPELNPNFKFLVEEASKIVKKVMVRTNLTIFFEKGLEKIPEFYKKHKVTVISSLPCYLEENVEKQRGLGVYTKSIEALKRLNQLGYGDSLELNLVYNPLGAYLPPDQENLERGYKKYLWEKFGIRFNHLFTIANAPLGRFKKNLIETGDLDNYFKLLGKNYNSDTLHHIMCKNLVSIDYRGVLYNCDFNQVADLPIKGENAKPLTIESLEELMKQDFKIETADHCYCCTAGFGSSCTGALTEQ